MENGYESLRKNRKKAVQNRYPLYVVITGTNRRQNHMTIDNFMNNVLNGKIEEIFADINAYIFEQENVDMDHVVHRRNKDHSQRQQIQLGMEKEL